MEPVRIDSFCQFHFVSNPGFSPDGRYIAFVVRQADLKSNSYPGNLYFYDTEKDSYSQLTTSGKVTSYIWLDEKSLLYPEGKTEEGGSKTIYHQIFMDGGEAFPLFEVPGKSRWDSETDGWLFLNYGNGADEKCGEKRSGL